MNRRRHSKETKEKLSNTVKKKYKNGYINPFKGKHHSEETKRKCGEANKGKKLLEEVKRNLSEKLKGVKKPPRTQEHIINLSNSRKGKCVGINHPNWIGGKPKCKECNKQLGGYKSTYCPS